MIKTNKILVLHPEKDLKMLFRAKLNISTRINNVVSQSAESITNVVFLLPLSLCKISISSKS